MGKVQLEITPDFLYVAFNCKCAKIILKIILINDQDEL